MTIILYAVAEARRPRHGPEISCLELTGGKKRNRKDQTEGRGAKGRSLLKVPCRKADARRTPTTSFQETYSLQLGSLMSSPPIPKTVNPTLPISAHFHSFSLKALSPPHYMSIGFKCFITWHDVSLLSQQEMEAGNTELCVCWLPSWPSYQNPHLCPQPKCSSYLFIQNTSILT